MQVYTRLTTHRGCPNRLQACSCCSMTAHGPKCILSMHTKIHTDGQLLDRRTRQLLQAGQHADTGTLLMTCSRTLSVQPWLAKCWLLLAIAPTPACCVLVPTPHVPTCIAYRQVAIRAETIRKRHSSHRLTDASNVDPRRSQTTTGDTLHSLMWQQSMPGLFHS